MAFLSNIKESDILNLCSKISLLGKERLLFNIRSINNLCEKGVIGDVVEIGVWKGGSILSMILALEKNSCLDRRIHLYDTFQGMTPSLEIDKDYENRKASDLISNDPYWLCICGIEEVKKNISDNTKYPSNLIQYHVGDICKTNFIPEKIALLRLDTDWYESTKFELDNFYPKVVSGGIVIIDDYGHWKGCRLAVDEFLKKHPLLKLNYIDYTGVYFIKP